MRANLKVTLTAMKTRPPKELIWLSAIALSGCIGTIVALGLSHGVGHSSNTGAMLGLPLAVGALATSACGLATLFCSCLAFRSSSTRWRVLGICIGILCLSVPWPLFQSLPDISAVTERRDFEKAGPQALREAARQLIHDAAGRDYTHTYMGREVPSTDVPAVIRAFAPHALRVTVSDHYVGLLTDGLGGWRGGYAIVPAGSDYVPPHSRRIADGFHYVVESN